ncbi:MAG TPA: type II toxin-antitoxin system HicA family toxin [Anaerolineae bacterium]|nr:type II toxin-antitoxin system HicA family toxin [Anaerolineae bacterium]
MRLPRDVGGNELASLLSRYGYNVTRQTGSHLRLTSSLKGAAHHVAIPRHKLLKLGTLSSILRDVATYLDMDKQALIDDLFEG